MGFVVNQNGKKAQSLEINLDKMVLPVLVFLAAQSKDETAPAFLMGLSSY